MSDNPRNELQFLTKKKLKRIFWCSPIASNYQSESKQTNAMSCTIVMPSALDESIKSVCTDAVQQAVEVLAAKYGFDKEEAARELNLGEMKLQRKRGPASKKSVSKAEKKSKSKEDKPKKRKTGYLLFSDEMRADIKELLLENLEEGEKLKPQDTVRELAAQWKALPDEEKAEWNERAASLPQEGEESEESEE